MREPEGSGCAERLVRTQKENLLRVRVFATVEAPKEFGRNDNERWPIRRRGLRTPGRVRRELVGAGLEAA